MTHPDELSTAEKADKPLKLTPEQSEMLARAGMVDDKLSGGIQHDGNGNLIEPEDGPKTDPAAENAAILSMLVGMATPALPFLSDCYTPEVIANIAGAYTAVEEKYGWNVRGMVGPELMLALVGIPPTFMAYTLGKKHFAELKAKREREEAEEARRVGKVPAQDARAHALGAN